MSAAIEDYEATARQVQEAARTDVLQAAREHDAHARQLQEELLASRTEETEGERALKLQLAEAASAAAEAAAAHEEELKFANEMLNQRSKEQAAALAALEGRLAERNDELQKSLSEEVRLQTELAQQGVQLASRHKGELTELKSAYNEAIEKLKAELLAMIEERATAVETAKRDYEAHSIAQQQDHQAKLLADREALAEREKEGARRQQEQLAARVAEYDEALAELRERTVASLQSEQQRAEGVLPAVHEQLLRATRQQEAAAEAMGRAMEAKLSEQQAIHSAEFDSLQKKYDAALDDAREQSAAARAELLRQAQAREEALLAQLGQQSGLGRAGPSAAVARLRRSRRRCARACRAGGAVEQCNAHWMEVLRRQSESPAYAAAEAERRRRTPRC